LFNENNATTQPVFKHDRTILNNTPIANKAVVKIPISILNINNEIITYNKGNKLHLFSLLPTKE
jgi:hypothetical protein